MGNFSANGPICRAREMFVTPQKHTAANLAQLTARSLFYSSYLEPPQYTTVKQAGFSGGGAPNFQPGQGFLVRSTQGVHVQASIEKLLWPLTQSADAESHIINLTSSFLCIRGC